MSSFTPTTVLVTFSSRCGETEQFALASAVGAVQARANIRLRRLPDSSSSENVHASPDCKENLARMLREYVVPAKTDVQWADAIILGLPARLTFSSMECAGYLELLSGLCVEGAMENRVAGVFTAPLQNDSSLITSLSMAVCNLGFVVVPPNYPQPNTDPIQQAVAHGRRVAAVARALKTRK